MQIFRLVSQGIITMSLSVGMGLSAKAAHLDEPFASANRNPLVQIYGLPNARSASITSNDHWRAELNLESSNNFAAEAEGDEIIFLDGETYRATMSWRYGFAENFDLAVDVPVISHQGGGVDGFIEDWHNLFSLPDGDRIYYPRDQLRYAYQKGDDVVLDMQDNGEGLGDVSLSMGWQLAANEQRLWAIRAGHKFATGDVDSLKGSDAADSYISLHLTENSLYPEQAISFHLSAGLLDLGDGKVLEEQQESHVWFGTTAVSWGYSETLSFKTQLDFHSAFYRSELKQIGDTSVQWLLGLSLQVTEKLIIDFSVSEDIAVESAPDVVFMFALRMGEWK